MACLCSVTLGSIVYKPAPPQKKLYIIWGDIYGN
jgi:hypothetical protein